MDVFDAQATWLYDDIAAAVEQSAATGKPLLVYWHAGWCPPCQEMRVGVLSSSEFALVARDCVRLQISGDAPGAQVWGDRWGLATYPTVLVLDAADREIARLPGGLPPDRFAEALRTAIHSPRPVTAVVRSVMHDTQALSNTEASLLAYHSWSQDDRTLQAGERVRFFGMLAKCISESKYDELTRVVAQLVIEQCRSLEPSSPEELASLCRHFVDLLAGPGATYANLYYLNVDPRPAIQLLSGESGPERGTLTCKWRAALENMLLNEPLRATDRLIVYAALVHLEKAAGNEQDVSPRLRERCESLVAEVDRATTDFRERQSAMNMAGHLLRFVGLPRESRRIFEAELTRSADPYYFMPYLADLARERNAVSEALDWMQRARDEARGAATRFALSGRLIDSLISMSPDDTERINRTVSQTLGEVAGASSIFYGVFRRTLTGIVNDLRSWAAADSTRCRVLAGARLALARIAATETDPDSRARIEAADEALSVAAGHSDAR